MVRLSIIPCIETSISSVQVWQRLPILNQQKFPKRQKTFHKGRTKLSAADHPQPTPRSDKTLLMVLDMEQIWRTRKIKEALHIAQQGCKLPLMNKDSGRCVTKIWCDQRHVYFLMQKMCNWAVVWIGFMDELQMSFLCSIFSCLSVYLMMSFTVDSKCWRPFFRLLEYVIFKLSSFKKHNSKS